MATRLMYHGDAAGMSLGGFGATFTLQASLFNSGFFFYLDGSHSQVKIN